MKDAVPAGETLIRAEHLYRAYGGTRAIEDVSFEVGRGEVLGFLGPNGAGKTTTMQIICGALAPSAGRVLIAGSDLREHPRRAKSRLGYLPERPPLYRDLLVAEYLAFCARVRGVPGNEVAAAVHRAQERCGLLEVGHRLIGNLSKGYQQRVGIAQAIVHRPAVIVLDEPTAGLDPIQIRAIRTLIRELGHDHAVILSTHILPEVQAVCNRVQIIHRGRLVFTERLEASGSAGAAPQGVAWLRVRLRHPPELAAIAALPGIGQVEPLGDGRFRVLGTEDEGAAERFAATAVDAGWGLCELVPEGGSLEEIFVQLTCGEATVGSTGLDSSSAEAGAADAAA